MNDKIANAIINYATKLADEGLATGVCSITFKHGNDVYTTKNNVDFAKITAEDIVLSTDSTVDDATRARVDADVWVLSLNEENAAVMRISPKYTLACSKSGRSIPPVLDDMSQILGVKIKCAASSSLDDIKKAIKGKCACLVKNEGALTTGRSLDEAFTAAMVMEKATRTYIRVTALGGPKNLGAVDANLQHIVYKIKYSKKNQAAKIAEEQEEA